MKVKQTTHTTVILNDELVVHIIKSGFPGKYFLVEDTPHEDGVMGLYRKNYIMVNWELPESVFDMDGEPKESEHSDPDTITVTSLGDVATLSIKELIQDTSLDSRFNYYAVKLDRHFLQKGDTSDNGRFTIVRKLYPNFPSYAPYENYLVRDNRPDEQGFEGLEAGHIFATYQVGHQIKVDD